MRFIDTHCHILPGIDDGPAGAAVSLEMAARAQAEGTTDIIATPHIITGVYEGDDVAERIGRLQEAMREKEIGVRLHAGAEVPMSICLTASPQSLKALALAGSRYLLMETAETTYDQLERAVYQIGLSGLSPVLAHPERVDFVARDPRRLAALVAGGEAFCQLTAASIEGRFGKHVRKTAVRLLDLGLVHLVATDAHRPSGGRAPGLAPVHAVLRELAGEGGAAAAVRDNPLRVLADEPMETISASGGRRGFLARLRRGRQ